MKVWLVVLFMCVEIFNITTGSYCVDVGPGGRGPDKSRMPEAMMNKCNTKDNFNQFLNAFETLSRCISRLSQEYPVPFDPVKNNEDYCSNLRENQYRMCVNDFTTNITQCLAGDEIYLEKLLRKAGDLILDELCGKNGISNMQYLYDTVNVSQQCMDVCFQFIVNFGACDTTNLYIFKQLDNGVLDLTKNAVCRDLDSLQKCIPQLMQGICNDDLSRLVDLVLSPFLTACMDLDKEK